MSVLSFLQQSDDRRAATENVDRIRARVASIQESLTARRSELRQEETAAAEALVSGAAAPPRNENLASMVSALESDLRVASEALTLAMQRQQRDAEKDLDEKHAAAGAAYREALVKMSQAFEELVNLQEEATNRLEEMWRLKKPQLMPFGMYGHIITTVNRDHLGAWRQAHGLAANRSRKG